jgi:hypothetical protein
MADAYIDTTIIVDALLKDRATRDTATKALKRFSSTQLPVYAIKEFKAGALSYLAWLHNKLVDTGAVGKTITAIHAVMKRQQGRAATALEAMANGLQESLGKATPHILLQQHGRTADDIICAELRIMLRYRIISGWSQRRSITTRVIQPLSCYPERDPIYRNGRIVLGPATCVVIGECCFADALRARPSDVGKVERAAADNGKLSAAARSVLHDLARGSKSPVTNQKCRSLGDAYFALFAPSSSTILTTNVNDHAVLAGALGKKVEPP